MGFNRAIFRRWFDIVLLSGVGTAAAYVLNEALANWAVVVQEFFASWALPEIVAVLVVFVALLAMVLVGLRGVAFTHIPLMLRYPPVWLAAAIAFLLCFGLSWLSGSRTPTLGYPDPTWMWSLIVVLSGILLALSASSFLERLPPRRQSTASDDGPAVAASGPDEALAAFIADPSQRDRWIAREEPIDSPRQDWFGVSRAAERTARRLYSDDPIRTFGLVGPWGSGKTSFCSLVRYYLGRVATKSEETESRVRHVWSCTVGAWGLDSGPSASEHILSAVIYKLSKRVDCLALSGLPQSYRAALSKGDGFVNRIFGALFGLGDDPVKLLRRLDPVLLAANARLVIFIEDVDRNDNASALLLQVESVLDRLRHLKNLSFVLAASERTDAGGENVDFARLCERVEVIPPLRTHLVWQVVSAFRDESLSKFESDIDPVRPQMRKIPDSIPEAEWRLPGNARVRFPYKDAAALLSTPRLLKYALRWVRDAWEPLHGEIDFDHLLAVGILKSGAPKAYNFWLWNSARFRNFSRTPPVDSTQHRDWVLQRDALLKEIRAGQYAEALVCYLFPSL